MKKTSYLKHIFRGIILIAMLSSCANLDIAPTNEFTELEYWTSEDRAQYVLNAAYSTMFNSSLFFRNEVLSDNMYDGRGSTSEKIISSGQADASNSRFSEEWSTCYSGIKTCNIFLENIGNVPDITTADKDRMSAECRFLRAWFYFRLTNWFGDVPFFTAQISLDDSKTVKPTDQETILAFIHSEMEDIISSLQSNDELATDERGRITKGAAIAFDARVYLYSSNWSKVAEKCEQLISSTQYGSYSLFSSYSGLFLPDSEYNSEVILDYAYVPSTRTWNDFFDLAPLSVGARLNSFAATEELVDDYLMLNGKTIDESGSGYDESNPYESRDPRLTCTIVYHKFQWEKPDGTISTIYIKPDSAPTAEAQVDEYGNSGNSTHTGYYLRKYYDPECESSFTSGLNLILIRYADVLLMYAEAKNELGEMNETIWNETIKALRSRAGFTDSDALDFNSSLSQDDLRTIIRRERRCELAIEGLRIFDIRRWKTAETVLNGYPHGAKYGDASVDNGYIRLDERTFNKDRDYLWAIPQSQIDLNPNLGQNPNY
jgi:starch-binding outer membrane protein, SusD/RagB family